MCKTILKSNNVPIKLWADIIQDDVESVALDQLKRIASLPWVVHHIAVMPDVHYGSGTSVGSVIAMKDAVAPAAVGVDIGCGLDAIKTNLKASDLPDDLKLIRHRIEKEIPLSHNGHEHVHKHAEKQRIWKSFSDLTPGVQDILGRARKQMGTLGGGNHFISINIDEKDFVWIMLHSGSRNIGKMLAEIHISKAKKLSHNAELPDKDLAVFLANTPEMQAYRHDLMWAQQYAFLNRNVMIEINKDILRKLFPKIKFDEPISCHHNYVSEEVHFGEELIITRKGAISAQLGQMGIIPGAMGQTNYIVRGLGNASSFNSASHGAGRKMSRGAAKRAFTVEDLEQQTYGVECKKDFSVLDEIPGAYKDLRRVMENQKDLVEIVSSLKEIMTVKG